MTTSSTFEESRLPRNLIFLASAWLFLSWILAIGLHPPLQPSSSVYTPAARLLLCSIVIGGTWAWPMLRLSGGIPRRPIRNSLLDWLSLAILLQILIWPVRLVTTWTVMRVAIIDSYLCVWLLISAGVIALSLRAGGIIRSWAMLLLIAWTTLPHLLGTFPGISSNVILASPLGQIWQSCSQGAEDPSSESWNRVGIWLVIALVIWTLNGILSMRAGVQNRISGSQTGEKDEK